MTIEALLTGIDQKLAQLLTAIQQSAAPPAVPYPFPPADPIPAGDAVVVASPAAPGASPAPEAPKRGRGRPPKGETPAPIPLPNPPGTGLAPVVQTAAQVVDPLGLDDVATPAQTYRAVTADELRAALTVYDCEHSEAETRALFKKVSGVETLASLKQDVYGKVFDAVLPSGKFTIANVRSVLVKANERVGNSGLAVLKSTAGVSNLKELTEDKFVAVILAARAVR